MAEASKRVNNGDHGRSTDGEGDNSDSSTPGSPAHAKFNGQKSKNNEMITIEINLTDPEDLARKLELIDLTDEETDALLRQALDLNKRLRKEMNRQALLDKSSAMARSTSFVVSAPASASPIKGPMKSSLPPVKVKGNIGSGRSQGSGHRSKGYSGSQAAYSYGRKPSPVCSQPSPYLQKSAFDTRISVSKL